jgi:hypothetical protein
MLTGVLAARNVLGAKYDLWSLDADEGYLEDSKEFNSAALRALNTTQPQVPEMVQSISA